MKKTIRSVALISLIFLSALSLGMLFTDNALGNGGVSPLPTASVPVLADEDTIVDPRGQTVKQAETIEMGRTVTLDVIQPVDFSLEVFDFEVLSVNIPMDLDLTLGMTFPADVEIAYDPYDVHTGTSLPIVVDLDTTEPYATVGVDFEADFAALNFDFLGLGNMLGFAAEWGTIDYEKSIDIPFFGVDNTLGSWISYDLLDEYYTLDSLLSMVGVGISLSEYGLGGGVGVNIQYNLYSYVTAKVSSSSAYDSQSETLRWDDDSSNTFIMDVDGAATHGDLYTVEIGDWVYHITHDVTFTVWADIIVDVLGLQIIDETWDYGYTLGLGELAFPERTDYSFILNPQVLAGKSVSTEASWSALALNWAPGGGNLEAFDYGVDIPAWPALEEWLDDMDVSLGLGASLDVNFPFDMKSYYNQRKVTAGDMFDYNILMDSVAAQSPNIGYEVEGFIDLSAVEILGFELGNYDFSIDDTLFELSDIVTPFGTETAFVEITETIGLDTLSEMLNTYIKDACYGINPDIQFQAWIAFEIEGYMTGEVVVTDGTTEASVVSATEFVWDEQFDTQTTRIQVAADAAVGENFEVSYQNLEYHMKLTPGVKLGVSVLGGLASFDYTFMIPGVSEYLQKTFEAPDFDETVTVTDLNVDAYDLTISDPVALIGDDEVNGELKFKNIGSVDENFNVELIGDNLPSGASVATLPQTYASVGVDVITTVPFVLDLGTDPHDVEYLMNEVAFKVSSVTDPFVFDIVSATINIEPKADLLNTKIIMESDLNVTPGLGVYVPVTIVNDGVVAVNYGVSVSGDDTVFSPVSFTVAAGATKTVEYLIDVPAEAASSLGDYDVDVIITEALSTMPVQNLTYSVQAFTKFSASLDNAFQQDWEVNFGDSNPQIGFLLENDGNVASDVTLGVSGVSGASFSTGSVTNVGSGATDVACVLTVDLDQLVPGVNTFEVSAEIDGEIVWSSEHSILVHQVLVSISAIDGVDEYVDEAITYRVSITNLGTADIFSLNVLGLEESAYVLTGVKDFALGQGQAALFELDIEPTEISEVIAGLNGLGISVNSNAYGTTELSKSMGVIMPTVYDYLIVEGDNKFDATLGYYDISFTIDNVGNVPDTFTLVIENIETGYIILVDGEEVDGPIDVARMGSAVVTVRFLKEVEGRYNPEVTILNGDAEVMGSVSGLFWKGTIYSTGFIATVVALAVSLFTLVGFVSMYSKGVIMPGSYERTTEKFRTWKTGMDMKKSESKDRKTIKKANKVRMDDLSELEKDIKQSKMENLKDKISEKKTANKEEKKKFQDLVNDDSFWGDSSADSSDSFDFED